MIESITVKGAEYKLTFNARDAFELLSLLNSLIGFNIVETIVTQAGIDLQGVKLNDGVPRDEAERRAIALFEEIFELDELPSDWLTKSRKRLSLDDVEVSYICGVMIRAIMVKSDAAPKASVSKEAGQQEILNALRDLLNTAI